MTIESNISKNIYIGNGQSTIFPFTFKIWKASEINVTIEDEKGFSKEIVPFSVTFSENGGEAVLYFDNEEHTPIPAGYSIAITRNMPFLQEQDYINGGRFNSEVVEENFDIACAERQELLEKISRAVMVSPASGKSPDEVLQDFLEKYYDMLVKYPEIVNAFETIYPRIEDVLKECIFNKNLAHAWAESDTPPNPDDPKSKSAKEWASIASDVIPIATSTLLGKVKLGETITGKEDGTIDVAEEVLNDIADNLSKAIHVQQIAQRSTAGSWTILCEPKKPLCLYVTGDNEYAWAWFRIKKNGGTEEKTPILIGYDHITGVQTSNLITILPQEEIIILEVFRISDPPANTKISAYQ